MIERIIEYSIRNRFLVLFLAAALTVGGIYAVLNTPVDAIPDLSENQVIVFTDWMGRSPKEIEDQITSTLSRKLQGLAGIKAVRSSSEFNFSMITIIFEDHVNFYFARQRVTEKLSQAGNFLPPGVVPYMAPDTTALGQIFFYTVEASSSNPIELPKLWALNKFQIVPQLNAAAGVADVATVGGLPLEYQIDVQPEKLRAPYNISLGELYSAVAKSNLTVGGGVIQKNNAEYLVRGIGWIKDKKDIEDTVIKEVNGTPVYVKNVAIVQLGTQVRRGVFEKDGNEVAGGIVMMRHGENPLAVTQRVKEKIQELQPALPKGVRIVPAYDRTRLIHGAISTLTEVMWHEMLIAALAILLILMHVRSVFVICVTLPLSVLFSFLIMWLLRQFGIIDIQANIMSLAGITISIGILVDQAIVMTENATHHLKEHFGDRKVTGDTRELVIGPCRTVGRPIFFSVLIMLISFIPVFMLSGREGKFFHPLAFTKSFALVGTAIISVTVVPALIPTFIRGRLRSEEQNWIVRSFINIYKPLLTWALPRRNLVMWMFSTLLIIAAGFFPIQAVFGYGAEESKWRIFFFIVFAVVTFLTVVFTDGSYRQFFIFVALWVLFFLAAYVVQLLALLTTFSKLLALPPWAERLIIFVSVLLLLTLFIFVSVVLVRRFPSKILAFASLVLLALWSFHLPKIGVIYIPALDEGTTLDMPVTAPRVGITQSADDLKHRDGLLRSFPEVESVIGKAGRADTPTDPAPLDMFETLVNFRPKALWPKRVLRWSDAVQQTRAVLGTLEERGFVERGPDEQRRDERIDDATQKTLTRFDETMRELALLRYREFERELGPVLTHFVVTQTFQRFHQAGDLPGVSDEQRERLVKQLADSEQLTRDFGIWLSKRPSLEDVTRITQQVAQRLARQKLLPSWYELTDTSLQTLRTDGVPESVLKQAAKLKAKKYDTEEEFLSALRAFVAGSDFSRYQTKLLERARTELNPADALAVKENVVQGALSLVGELLGSAPKTFAGEVLTATENLRDQLWRERVKQVNWELFERGVEAYTWYSLEELVKGAQDLALLQGAAKGVQAERFTTEAVRAQLGKPYDRTAFQPFVPLREELEKPFRSRVFLWQRQGGTRGDLVDDEMGRVLQVPGWVNIFTQPIVNRMDMLATGIKTQIGIKVFGPDLDTVERVSKDIEAAVKPITGARDVLAALVNGKGYLEIDIDRLKAARYGISVEDIQNEIEVALGGRVITYTVEKRERFPVRIRYARAHREDEESVKRLLVSPGSMATPASMSIAAKTMPASPWNSGMSLFSPPPASGSDVHRAAPQHAASGKTPVQLQAVASVRIVEGPVMIKSENGRLVTYVTLNVRGRDVVGFVDEAKRIVAQKVQLPEGVHVEWAGEFEHQVRAAKTLRFVIPAVVALIFLILYLTYRDVVDALLMLMAVPEALAGGAFFMYLFPKITGGWDTPPMDFSLTVWVGFIACFGMATETGIIMLVYLREAIEKRGGLENIQSLEELRQAVIEGAVHRLRPKLLTEGVAIIAIFPMVFATGVGGEILAPMALPVLGGLLISDEVVDLFLPVRFYWVRRARWLKLQAQKAAALGA